MCTPLQKAPGHRRSFGRWSALVRHWPQAALLVIGIVALVVAMRALQPGIHVVSDEKILLNSLPLPSTSRNKLVTGAIAKMSDRAIPPLLDIVRFDPVSVPRIAAALVGLGPAEIPALVEALDDSDPNVRLALVRAISMLAPKVKPAPETTLNALTSLLNDPNHDVRQAAVRALTRLQGDPSKLIPAIERALRSEPAIGSQGSDFRVALLRLFGSFGPSGQAALPVIQEFLGDADLAVQEQAAAAYSQISEDPTPAIAALRSVLVEEHDPYRWQTAALLHWRVTGDTNLVALCEARLAVTTSPKEYVCYLGVLAGIGLPARPVLPFLTNDLQRLQFGSSLEQRRLKDTADWTVALLTRDAPQAE